MIGSEYFVQMTRVIYFRWINFINNKSCVQRKQWIFKQDLIRFHNVGWNKHRVKYANLNRMKTCTFFILFRFPQFYLYWNVMSFCWKTYMFATINQNKYFNMCCKYQVTMFGGQIELYKLVLLSSDTLLSYWRGEFKFHAYWLLLLFNLMNNDRRLISSSFLYNLLK